MTKTHPYLSIMHEVYEAPKGHWENIHMNNQLVGLCMSTWKESPTNSQNLINIQPSWDTRRGAKYILRCESTSDN